MANVITDNTHYTNIANSIRSKLGVTTKYKPSEMASAIASIKTGSDITIDGEVYDGDQLNFKKQLIFNWLPFYYNNNEISNINSIKNFDDDLYICSGYNPGVNLYKCDNNYNITSLMYIQSYQCFLCYGSKNELYIYKKDYSYSSNDLYLYNKSNNSITLYKQYIQFDDTNNFIFLNNNCVLINSGGCDLKKYNVETETTTTITTNMNDSKYKFILTNDNKLHIIGIYNNNYDVTTHYIYENENLTEFIKLPYKIANSDSFEPIIFSYKNDIYIICSPSANAHKILKFSNNSWTYVSNNAPNYISSTKSYNSEWFDNKIIFIDVSTFYKSSNTWTSGPLYSALTIQEGYSI